MTLEEYLIHAEQTEVVALRLWFKGGSKSVTFRSGAKESDEPIDFVVSGNELKSASVTVQPDSPENSEH